jgi:hypothetical protein
MRRPNTKTIIRVIAWLEEQGLGVYGPAVQLEAKQRHFGQMDYTAEQAIQYAKIKDQLKPPRE